MNILIVGCECDELRVRCVHRDFSNESICIFSPFSSVWIWRGNGKMWNVAFALVAMSVSEVFILREMFGSCVRIVHWAQKCPKKKLRHKLPKTCERSAILIFCVFKRTNAKEIRYYKMYVLKSCSVLRQTSNFTLANLNKKSTHKSWILRATLPKSSRTVPFSTKPATLAYKMRYFD